MLANWLLLFLSTSAMQGGVFAFNPSNYAKSAARCIATKREPVQQDVHIELKYVEINLDAPTTLLMVHGWPSLWSTWSNQIEEFQHDYHLIIPDLRGFGGSTHPGDVRSSGTLGDMVDDLVCILQQAKVESVICMGHDWGSTVCYEAARLRPDIFKAVIGIVVPYIPAAGPFIPIKKFTPIFPTLSYQIFFDSETDAAVAELDQDIRRTIRATLRTVASPPPDTFLKSNVSFLSAWDGVEKIPPVPFFTPGEEDYFVNQYCINGFRNTLQFYSNQNRLLGWELANAQGNHTIPQPVLAIYPTEDPVADWEKAAIFLQSYKYLPNLTVKLLSGAHWVHLENPLKCNNIIRKWLRSLP
ncbi:alpha/beta-hydrolase [Phlegmacium glaucopus]|nr:alpha/beta-hydrolase [Phlegmacium glaucopus]